VGVGGLGVGVVGGADFAKGFKDFNGVEVNYAELDSREVHICTAHPVGASFSLQVWEARTHQYSCWSRNRGRFRSTFEQDLSIGNVRYATS
jgi:hypothetical protein